MDKLKFIFDSYDDDKDGQLTREEFYSFMYEIGRQETLENQFQDCFDFIREQPGGDPSAELITEAQFMNGLPDLYEVNFVLPRTEGNAPIEAENSPHYYIFRAIQANDAALAEEQEQAAAASMQVENVSNSNTPSLSRRNESNSRDWTNSKDYGSKDLGKESNDNNGSGIITETLAPSEARNKFKAIAKNSGATPVPKPLGNGKSGSKDNSRKNLAAKSNDALQKKPDAKYEAKQYTAASSSSGNKNDTKPKQQPAAAAALPEAAAAADATAQPPNANTQVDETSIFAMFKQQQEQEEKQKNEKKTKKVNIFA